jgi:hypothetical protein
VFEVFGAKFRFVQSTSPVQGKHCASIVGPDGSAWPDMFLWDPMSQLVQFDEDRLDALLFEQRRRQLTWLGALAWLADAGIYMARMVRALFSGSYGGSLGFGPMGSIVGIMSGVLLIVASAAAAVVIAPLALVGWIARTRMAAQVRRERQVLVVRAQAFFAENGSETHRASSALID